jgi:hypothetical protein
VSTEKTAVKEPSTRTVPLANGTLGENLGQLHGEFRGERSCTAHQPFDGAKIVLSCEWVLVWPWLSGDASRKRSSVWLTLTRSTTMGGTMLISHFISIQRRS